MRETTVQKHLFWKYRAASELLVPGYAPARWWENDLFRLTNASYWYEYEFKSSYRDFLADFEKKDNRATIVGVEGDEILVARFRKHSILAGTDEGNGLVRSKQDASSHQAARNEVKTRREGWRQPKGCTFIQPPGPNRFSFVIPDHLEDKIRPKLPEYAGLMLVSLQDEGTSMEKVTQVREVVKAPQRHRQKVFEVDALKKKLFETFYWRYWRSK